MFNDLTIHIGEITGDYSCGRVIGNSELQIEFFKYYSINSEKNIFMKRFHFQIFGLQKNSVVHFGILNSLRSWNYFDLPKGVESNSNVGGFGCVSSLIGASLANKDKLYFSIVGDFSMILVIVM